MDKFPVWEYWGKPKDTANNWVYTDEATQLIIHGNKGRMSKLAAIRWLFEKAVIGQVAIQGHKLNRAMAFLVSRMQHRGLAKC